MRWSPWVVDGVVPISDDRSVRLLTGASVLGLLLGALGVGLLTGLLAGGPAPDRSGEVLVREGPSSTGSPGQPSVRLPGWQEDQSPRRGVEGSGIRPRTPELTPHRLEVPSLGVDSPVVPITATNGVLVPPDDPQVLGWWRDGARVGADRGGVLITGHTVHTGGGAFDHLESLAAGDIVRVGTSQGDRGYRVADVTYYPKQTLARVADAVFDQSGRPRLVLVTCEDWDGVAYRGNTVVIAEPMSGTGSGPGWRRD